MKKYGPAKWWKPVPAAFKDWHTYFKVDTKGSFGVLNVQHAFFKQRCCRCVNSENLSPDL